MITLVPMGTANDGRRCSGPIKGSVVGGQDAAWPGQIRVRRQGLEPRTRGLRAWPRRVRPGLVQFTAQLRRHVRTPLNHAGRG